MEFNEFDPPRWDKKLSHYPLTEREQWGGLYNLSGAHTPTEYEAQAQREVTMGHHTPQLGWEGGRGYTTSDRAYLQRLMEDIDPRIAEYNLKGMEHGAGLHAQYLGRKEKEAKIGDLRSLMTQLNQPSDYIFRWLLEKRIGDLQQSIASYAGRIPQYELSEDPEIGISKRFANIPIKASANLEALGKGEITFEDYLSRQSELKTEQTTLERDKDAFERAFAASGAPAGGEFDYAPGPEDLPSPPSLPVPEWMMPYLEPAMSGIKEAPKTGIEATKGREKPVDWLERKAFAARPLGAQAELTPEEMELMKGRIGWAGGGAPVSIRDREGFEKGLAGKKNWWEEYTRLSQSLFPETKKLSSRWRR